MKSDIILIEDRGEKKGGKEKGRNVFPTLK